jgi:taurine dioxygenase
MQSLQKPLVISSARSVSIAVDIRRQNSASDLLFRVKPLEPFGAEIIGLDFHEGCNANQILALRAELIKHKMLLIRSKSFSPAEQVAFTRSFGSELLRAGPTLRFLQDHPEVFQISNRLGTGNVNTGQYWHADGHYLADPSSISIMHIVNATNDGLTHVTDTSAAYDRLPAKMQRYLRGFGFFANQTGVCHPIVREHPLTGRLGLYVNLRAMAVDRAMREAPYINEVIDNHLSQAGTFYQHLWKQGDTIIVDNFASAHRGTHSDPANLRVMHRTTVTGSSVWWRSSH